MRRLVVLLALALAALPEKAAAEVVAQPECNTILPAPHKSGAQRPLVPDDLVRLRDIGPVDPDSFAEPLFTISPDGRSAAFQLRRGDAERNS